MNVFNPSVSCKTSEKITVIHRKRMAHAFGLLCARLVALNIPEVDFVLNQFGIAIIPGPVVGIDYPDGARQILSQELADAKAEAEVKAKLDAGRRASKNKRKSN